jgi:hypothetical protein
MPTKLEAQLGRNGLAPDHNYPAYIARLTDQNQHWQAAASIAARYGNPTEEAAIDTFNHRQAKRGYSEPSEIACRTAILAGILDRLPANVAAELREAL